VNPALFTKPLRSPLLFHGGSLFLKAENLQPGGSYKVRGVHHFFRGATREELAGGLSTVSAGNLGRSLAEACRAAGVPCTIYVPNSAPAVKKEKIRALGALLRELSFDEVFALVKNPPAEPGFLHPLLTPGLPEGYGEIANEILEDLPETRALLVPFGLGGLALGLTRALKKRGSKLRVIAAELETCAPYAAALAAGNVVKVENTASFVDAIGTPEVMPYVFAEARHAIKESIVVSLTETRAALRELLLLHGIRVEGAAAVALAAAKRFALENPGVKTVALLTGSNIDPEVFAREVDQRAARLASSISATSLRLSSSS
jgi:threonine dehydratase